MKSLFNYIGLFLISSFGLMAPVSIGALFDDDAIIDIELRGPLESLNQAGNEGKELPFQLTAEGVTHNVQVRVRGNSRLRVCAFAPLRINFKKNEVSSSVFAGQDKLKLVTHCGKRNSAQTNALQEYLAYRIYNLITPISYKARLVRMHYIDSASDSDGSALVRYGFFLESRSGLATRVNGQAIDIAGVSLQSLDDEHMAGVYLFQYLIGNTDWSLVTAEGDTACCHNGEMLEIADKKYYVPYDFDLSGLVNAPYAKPDPSLRIKRVRKRLYRGFCTSPAVLQQSLQDLKAQQSDIMQLVSSASWLPAKARKESAGYLGEFFKKADREEKLLKHFERRCL